MSDFLRRRHEAIGAVLRAEASLSDFARPLRLVSVANGSQGMSLAGQRWRSERRKAQRMVGEAAGRQFRPYLEPTRWLVVRLVRVAPRELDDDNLARAFKAVRDGLAQGMGLDDRDPAVRYVVDTERGAAGEYSVRLELYDGGDLEARDRRPARRSSPGGFNPTPNVRRSASGR